MGKLSRGSVFVSASDDVGVVLPKSNQAGGVTCMIGIDRHERFNKKTADPTELLMTGQLTDGKPPGAARSRQAVKQPPRIHRWNTRRLLGEVRCDAFLQIPMVVQGSLAGCDTWNWNGPSQRFLAHFAAVRNRPPQFHFVPPGNVPGAGLTFRFRTA